MAPDAGASALAEKRRTFRGAGVVAFAMFTSTGTLVCCALPIMLVSIAGLGAFVASMTSTFPILITLSLHKEWVFTLSGLILVLSGWMVWRPGRSCPNRSRTCPLVRHFSDVESPHGFHLGRHVGHRLFRCIFGVAAACSTRNIGDGI